MNEIAYSRLVAMATTPEALNRSAAYIKEHICPLLKKRERVLICFPNNKESIGYVMEQAVLACGAIPIILKDLRWKTILREAFSQRCAMIVSTPLLALGLSKLAKRMETPLYARNVILAGYPSSPWMIEGIKHGLDCRISGCYDPGAGCIVAGFSCDSSGAICVRSDVYGVELLDEHGSPAEPGTLGEIVLYPVSEPENRFHTGDIGRLATGDRSCADACPRLVNIDPVHGIDADMAQLGADLHLWTSILDCRMARTGYGLELEIVTFPGEKLPKLPSCAKLVIRNWDPEHDMPFPHMYILKKRHFYSDNG